MNDDVYQLDTTFRATDRRNCRVIEWKEPNEKPPIKTKLIMLSSDGELGFGCFNECFIPDDGKFLGKRITHWASIDNLKPL